METTFSFVNPVTVEFDECYDFLDDLAAGKELENELI